MTHQNEQLQALEAAGFPIDFMSEDQLAVYASLTAQEVELLIDLRSRLDAAEPEVQAHNVAGAGMF
jgi:hypothetical protein